MATSIFNQLIPVDILTFDNIDWLRVSPRTRVTDHPVEFGVDVSDHAQTLPLEVRIRGRITATPLLIPSPTALELATAFFERSERQLMTISTSRGVFANMMVTAYPWANEGRDEVVFDLVAREVRIAFAVSVLIPPRTPAPPLQAAAATVADAGVQPPVPVPAPPATSILAAFL